MLDHCLELLVGKARDRIRVLELMLSWNQQREDFAVCGWLGFGHPSYRPLPLSPEMAQQSRNELLVQYRSITRAVRTPGRVAKPFAGQTEFELHEAGGVTTRPRQAF